MLNIFMEEKIEITKKKSNQYKNFSINTTTMWLFSVAETQDTKSCHWCVLWILILKISGYQFHMAFA